MKYEDCTKDWQFQIIAIQIIVSGGGGGGAGLTSKIDAKSITLTS